MTTNIERSIGNVPNNKIGPNGHLYSSSRHFTLLEFTPDAWMLPKEEFMKYAGMEMDFAKVDMMKHLEEEHDKRNK